MHVPVEDATEIARRAPHARELEELLRVGVRVRVRARVRVRVRVRIRVRVRVRIRVRVRAALTSALRNDEPPHLGMCVKSSAWSLVIGLG